MLAPNAYQYIPLWTWILVDKVFVKSSHPKSMLMKTYYNAQAAIECCNVFYTYVLLALSLSTIASSAKHQYFSSMKIEYEHVIYI